MQLREGLLAAGQRGEFVCSRGPETRQILAAHLLGGHTKNCHGHGDTGGLRVYELRLNGDNRPAQKAN